MGIGIHRLLDLTLAIGRNRLGTSTKEKHEVSPLLLRLLAASAQMTAWSWQGAAHSECQSVNSRNQDVFVEL